MKTCGDPPLANYHKFSYLSEKIIIFPAKFFFKLFANERKYLQNFRKKNCTLGQLFRPEIRGDQNHHFFISLVAPNFRPK